MTWLTRYRVRHYGEASQGTQPERPYRGIGIAALVLAVLALLTPLGRAQVYGRAGLLLVLAAVLEIAHGFRRSTAQGQRSAWFGAAITLSMGLLLINAPNFAVAALWLFLAVSFGQSFIEVRIEPTKGPIRLLPYGVHGQPHWREMEVSAGTLPAGTAPDSPVECVVEIPRKE
jgi:hypothetical protein